MTNPVLPTARTVDPLIPVQEIRPVSSRIGMAAGELLEALVLGRHSDGKVTLQVKNMSISADTLVPLKAGDRLTVRVEQTLPQVILRMVGGTDRQNLVDLLRLHRAGSGAMGELFSGAKDTLSPAMLEAQTGRNAANIARMLLQTLDTCLFTRTTVENPLFLKDMMSMLGLLLERNLFKGRATPERGESVKELLLKLAAELLEAGAGKSLGETLTFVERSTKAIEGQQIAAVLGQELDRSLVLQVFFQLPSGIRAQDIFIDLEAEGPEGRRRFHCILLLSLDALGDVVADAMLCGQRLDCVLYCETAEGYDFLNAALHDLQDRLNAAGYTESFIRCAIQRDIQDIKGRYIAQKNLYALHAVDIHT